MNLFRPLRNLESPVGLYLGWIVWSSALVVLYGVQGLGCSLGWAGARIGPMDSLMLTLTLVWLVHLVLLVWLTVLSCRNADAARQRPSEMQGFIRLGSRISLASAAVATAWLGFPILLLHPCA